METELELKFLVATDIGDALAACLKRFRVDERTDVQLGNIYFDTDDRRLRALDCGLRIRTRDGQHEQTIKTAGQVVGGLYKRPEYNLPLDGEWPDLSAFPADIWPAGTDVAALQAALHPLFRTDFRRRTWLVVLDDRNRVEVAYDVGQIQAEDRQEPLAEVELELVTGSVDALFQLADTLAELGGLRLGSASKAQRGYRLAGLAPAPEVVRMGFAPVAESLSVGQGLFVVLQYALHHWQYHEQLFMEQPSIEALVQLRNGVALMQQAQVFFADIYLQMASRPWQSELTWLEGELAWLDEALVLERMSANRAHYLRPLHAHDALLAVLQRRQQALPSMEKMQALLCSPRYARLLLTVTKWIVGQEELLQQPDGLRDAPLRPYANQQLELSWQELHEGKLTEPNLDYAGYLSLVGKLRRNLLVGVSFAALYDAEQQQGFRLPWLGILRRMEDLEHFDVLDRLSVELDTADRLELGEWLTAKVEPQLLELDQIRHQAQEMVPYWDPPQPSDP